MDEEPMEEFVLITNTPTQPMEAPTVPKSPSRRCRPAKSRESSASSRPLTESDSAEPAAPSPKIPDDSQNVSKANDSISAEIFQHENIILDNSGTSSQFNESMGSLAAGDTPSKPKKMHWKTKQKLENLEKKRLKALVNDRLKSPKDKDDAGGSQKGSTDDPLTTFDSTVTDHFDATAPLFAPPQPSPAKDLEMSQRNISQDSINDAKPLAPSSSTQGTSSFSTKRRCVDMVPPIPPPKVPKLRNSPQQQQQPQETMQQEVPQQVAAHPPAEKRELHLRAVKEEAAAPPRAPPQQPLVPFPRPPAQLNFMPPRNIAAPPRLAPLTVAQPPVAPPFPPMPIRVKAEPEDSGNNDCVIVGIIPAAPPAQAVPLAPLAPTMGYITPEHITVDAAAAEIHTLYSRIDSAFLFLFHEEVKRYITALTNPPGRP